MPQKTRWFGIWYGGSGYGTSDPMEDVEKVASIREAKDNLSDRYHNGYTFRMGFKYANRQPQWDNTPCVELDSEIWLWSADRFTESPIDTTDYYPDKIVKFGPRGGVVVEDT